MKRIIMVLAASAALATLAPPAHAQNYPWCEYLGSGMGGAKNCGFVSFEQCIASARGNGGDCRRNTMYTPPPGDRTEFAAAPLRHHPARRKQRPHGNS